MAIIETIKQQLGLTLFLIEHVMKLISALRQRRGAHSATLSTHPLQPELSRQSSLGGHDIYRCRAQLTSASS